MQIHAMYVPPALGPSDFLELQILSFEKPTYVSANRGLIYLSMEIKWTFALRYDLKKPVAHAQKSRTSRHSPTSQRLGGRRTWGRGSKASRSNPRPVTVSLRPGLVLKIFYPKLSHRILRHIHRVLNIYEKN